MNLNIPVKIIRQLGLLIDVAFYCAVLFLGWLGLWFTDFHHTYYVQLGLLEDNRLTSEYAFGVAFCLLPSLALWIAGAKGRFNSMLQLVIVTVIPLGLFLDPINFLIIGWAYLLLGWALLRRLRRHLRQMPIVVTGS